MMVEVSDLYSHCLPGPVDQSLHFHTCAWECHGDVISCASLPSMSQNNISVTRSVHKWPGRLEFCPSEAVHVNSTLLTIDFYSSELKQVSVIESSFCVTLICAVCTKHSTCEILFELPSKLHWLFVFGGNILELTESYTRCARSCLPFVERAARSIGSASGAVNR